MRVMIDIPDRYFQEEITRCEEKTGRKFDGMRNLLSKLESYNVNSEILKEDEILYKWLTSLTINKIIDDVEKISTN